MEEIKEVFDETTERIVTGYTEALDQVPLPEEVKKMIIVKMEAYARKEVEKLWYHFTEEMPKELEKIVMETIDSIEVIDE